MNNDDKEINKLIEHLVNSPIYIKNIPPVLLNDEDFISKLLNASSKYKWLFFAHISDELKGNKEFICDVIKDNPEMLPFTQLQNDRDFMLTMIRKNINFLDYIPESLKNDEEIMSLAIKRSGDKLKDAPENIKDNKEVVLEAIASLPLMLKFASPRLKDDEKVVAKAVALNHHSIIFASNRLKEDKDFALTLIGLNHNVLNYLSNEIRSDKEIALTVYKKDKNSIKLFSQSLIKEIKEANISKDNVEKYLEMFILKAKLNIELEENNTTSNKIKI